jgi:cytochrome b subunit of formate dehydrogenase
MAEHQQRYKRFSAIYRIEHWVLTASFGLLALTGLVQIYFDTGLAQTVVGGLGGIEAVRIVHRVAAVVMMLQTIFHMGHVGYRIFVLRVPMSMLPGLVDVRNAINAVLYNLDLRKERPLEDHYSFAEKLEYWAVVWGAIVMGATGFILWNPIATTQFLPGIVVPTAVVAHGLEATLAVLAIIVWHIYHVHLRHFNRSIFTGYLTEEEMLDEHPAALARIKAGKVRLPAPPEAVARRRRIFIPVYAVLAVLMLAAVYFFVAYEQTAIATVPPAEDVTVFAPLTPTPFPTVPSVLPTVTPGAASPGTPEVSWTAGIAGMLNQRCVECHDGAKKEGELDLRSYQAAMAGGISGPAVVPGEANTSLLITRQASGNHPGQLIPAELDLVFHWIEIGAPEE